ncbi:hypothetical protein SAMD00023353_0300360 [Rosellinia necatrix]|uniref:Uncharacterized protein n=1 Tax=Rosellinia necatrix TaxID=77044 RepID=A0A1S8A676_ROSNE|nr:hypothetical protein SAMD00023353_0300360 [Rosellinia necatrix]
MVVAGAGADAGAGAGAGAGYTDSNPDIDTDSMTVYFLTPSDVFLLSEATHPPSPHCTAYDVTKPLRQRQSRAHSRVPSRIPSSLL